MLRGTEISKLSLSLPRSVPWGTLTFGAFALAAVVLLRRALVDLQWLLNYPFPSDGIEGTLLHEARLLWSGQALYRPLERHGFVSAPYTPLHPFIVGLADMYQGPHIFWSGRLVSIAAALGIGALIILLVRRWSGAMLAGLGGAAIFLSAPPVVLWATRVKPDLFALFWTTLGLLVATPAFEQRRGERAWRLRTPEAWCAWAALIFAVAFFAKQTALAAPLATGLALLLADLRSGWASGKGRFLRAATFRRTLVFGLTYAMLVGGLWMLLQLITHGQFAAHVQGLHRSEWWSSLLLRKYVRLLAPYWPSMLLGVALVARAMRSDRALLPACYLLVAPVTLLGAAEISANHNHLLETLLALSLAGATCVGIFIRTSRHPLLVVAPLALLWAFQFTLAFRPQPRFAGELRPPDPPERFINFIRHTPGEVLADNVGLLLAAGRPVRYDDPSTMGPASVSGVWDAGGLIEEIRQRRFSAIMIPDDVREEPVDGVGRWTSPMRAAIREHYTPKFRDHIIVYVPK